MTWETLDRDLAKRIPVIAPRLDRERELWAPDSPGQDIVLGDVFAPHVLRLLEESDTRQDELGDAFALIEDLAKHTDERLEWLAVVSVLEALEDHPLLLKRGAQWMGPATREKLPTREWVRTHGPTHNRHQGGRE